MYILVAFPLGGTGIVQVFEIVVFFVVFFPLLASVSISLLSVCCAMIFFFLCAAVRKESRFKTGLDNLFFILDI